MKTAEKEITESALCSWNETFLNADENNLPSNPVVLFDGNKFHLTSSLHGLNETDVVILDYGYDGSEIRDVIESVKSEKWSKNDLIDYLTNIDKI